MPTNHCNHLRCKLDTASELLWLSKVLSRPELKMLIPKVLFDLPEVRCRIIPHRGNPPAPLPGDNT